MGDEEKLSYDELKRRLGDAESALTALRHHEVDAVVGDDGIAYVRLKDMQDALQAKTEQLRDVLESIRDAFLSVDEQHRITYANEQAAEISGLDAEELIGSDLWESFPALDGDAMRQLWERSVDSDEPGHAGIRLDDGRWLAVSVYPATAGLSIHWRDITETKQAEQAREEQRALMEALIQNASIGIAVIDRDGRVLLSNPAYANIAALSKPATVGACLYDILPANGREAFRQMLELAVDHGEPARLRAFESQSPTMERPAYWDIDYIPLAGGDGEIRSVLALTYDVTKLIEARQTVEAFAADTERSLKQLETVLANIDQGLLIIDADNTISMANTAAREMFGQAEHLVPETMDELRSLYEITSLSGDPIPAEDLPFSRILRGERVSGVELRATLSLTGERCIYSLSGAPVHDADGNLTFGIITISDVTERVAIADQLRALNEDLEAQVAERTFIAEKRASLLQSMAAALLDAEQRERARLSRLLHDHLQQLLTAAQMRGHLLGSQIHDDVTHDMLVELTDLVTEAVNASRSLAVELSPPVLAHGLAAAMKWLGEQMASSHKFHVDVQVEGEVNLESEEMAGFLLQATRELLFNAVKHSGVKSAVVQVEYTDESLVLQVSDEGVGFDPAELVVRDGTEPGGLGLWNLARRMDLLGGSLNIESKPGEGAAFCLHIPAGPLKDASAPPAPARRPVASRDRTDRDGEALHVLVVDDHDIVRGGLIGLLEDFEDLTVVGEACDGATAISMADELQPDVVVMDVSMPGMTGIEATREICQSHPEIRIIALSMHEESAVNRAMREAGAHAFVTKGGPCEDLVAAIRGEVEVDSQD